MGLLNSKRKGGPHSNNVYMLHLTGDWPGTKSL